MKKLKIITTVNIILAFLANVSFAAQTNSAIESVNCKMNPRNFKELIMDFFIGCYVNPAMPVLMSVVTLVFLWGVFKFVRAEGDNKKKAKDFLVWGIVGLFVMVSIWGLVNILQYTFRLDNTQVNITPINTNFSF